MTDYIKLTPTSDQDLASDMVTGLEYNGRTKYKLIV